MLQLPFNPGLTLTGFRTTRPRRKSHHPIDTLLAGFHVGPLSRSNFISEVRNAGFFAREGAEAEGGGGTGEHRDLEKDPGTKAKSNNKLYPHVVPGQNRTVAIVGNGRRRALSRLRHFCARSNVFIILIALSNFLCIHREM